MSVRHYQLIYFDHVSFIPATIDCFIVIVGTTLLCSDIYRCSFVYIVMCRSSHRPCLVYVSLGSVVGLAETFPCWQTYQSLIPLSVYVWLGLPTGPSVHLHFSNCSDIFCFVSSFYVSEAFQPSSFHNHHNRKIVTFASYKLSTLLRCSRSHCFF